MELRFLVEPHAPRGNKLKNGVVGGNPWNAPRCFAKTRQRKFCKSPAMKNGRCRMHGGKSTGPRTQKGLERSIKANWKHGKFSIQSIKKRKQLDVYIKLLNEKNYILGYLFELVLEIQKIKNLLNS